MRHHCREDGAQRALDRGLAPGRGYLPAVVCYDIFSSGGPIFSEASQDHVFTASIAILMPLIVIAGLIFRPRRKTPLRMSWYSVALIVVYLGGACALFTAP